MNQFQIRAADMSDEVTTTTRSVVAFVVDSRLSSRLRDALGNAVKTVTGPGDLATALESAKDTVLAVEPPRDTRVALAVMRQAIGPHRALAGAAVYFDRKCHRPSDLLALGPIGFDDPH